MNIYERVLGEQWMHLHPEVRRSHQPPLSGFGSVNVEAHPGAMASLLSRIGFPTPGEDVPCSLAVTEDEQGRIVWTRAFGPEAMVTRHELVDGLIRETSHWGAIDFALREEQGSLVYESRSCRFLGMKMPARLQPRISARVSPRDSGWSLQVKVEDAHRIVAQYYGWMVPR